MPEMTEEEWLAAAVAEREALIDSKQLADRDAQAWDGPHTLRHYVQRKDQAENDPYSIHHGGCTYLVLDLDHDPLAAEAAEAYADACAESHPEFAASLRALIDGDRP
jgi:hypothetical protein